MKPSTIVKSGVYVTKMLADLFLIWLTLGWKVRKARKAFEKELVKCGISPSVAKRLGEKYSSMKDKIMKQVWSSVGKFRR